MTSFSSTIACTILNAIEETSDIPDLMWSDGTLLAVCNWHESKDLKCNLCYAECDNRIKKHFMWDIKEDCKAYINLSICYQCYVNSKLTYSIVTHPDLDAVVTSTYIELFEEFEI